MSILFGIRRPLHARVTIEELAKYGRATARWAVDGMESSINANVGMAVQPFQTHSRSKLDLLPVHDHFGNLLTLDGRLDNHEEIRALLDLGGSEVSDSSLMLRAFLRWGAQCFARFVGDWAVALWSAQDSTMYLARDHAGTRTLYYSNSDGVVIWSTFLETFFETSAIESLDKDYFLRYLSSRPIVELTPYKNVEAVPPAHYVAIEYERTSRQPHWEWFKTSRIRYKTDPEYNEHFLSVLTTSVDRRTGPGAPPLAELSGGVDSSSIVCTSDRIQLGREARSELIRTISYYDDSEPDWNETPFFSAIEEQRGQVGLHLSASAFKRGFDEPGKIPAHYLLPGADALSIEREREYLAGLNGVEYRVIISGIGGDEILGGVPTPFPGLADQLLCGESDPFLKSAVNWCLSSQETLAATLAQVFRFIAKLYMESEPDYIPAPPWLVSLPRPSPLHLTWRQHSHEGRSAIPSAISNGLTWWALVETLPHLNPEFLVRREYRYPLLDRDVVDFVFSVPQDQLRRPGRRRYMMRNALKGIVPEVVLERKRKARLSRRPLLELRAAHQLCNFKNSFAADLGLINFDSYKSAFDTVTRGYDLTWIHAVRRVVNVEMWLRSHDLNSSSRPLYPESPKIRPSFAGPTELRPNPIVG